MAGPSLALRPPLPVRGAAWGAAAPSLRQRDLIVNTQPPALWPEELLGLLCPLTLVPRACSLAGPSGSLPHDAPSCLPLSRRVWDPFKVNSTYLIPCPGIRPLETQPKTS